MDKARRRQLELLEKILKYKFKNRMLLNTAMTHKSYAFEHSQHMTEWNERLEFFGDSVLGLIISEYFYKRFKNLQEGALTKLKSQIVCMDTLKKHAHRLQLGEYLLLGKGEERMGGIFQPSSLGSVLEALIGAVYLDRDLKATKKFIFHIFKMDLQDIHTDKKRLKDYKSILQEESMKRFRKIPFYELISQEGPEHRKEFVVAVRLNGQAYGQGWGFSKKTAQQMAAKEALEKLGA